MNDESMVKSICMDADDIERAVTRMAHQILEANKGADNLALVGIVTRGDLLAKMLVHKIEEIEGVKVPLGKLDISFYRDESRRSRGSRFPWASWTSASIATTSRPICPPRSIPPTSRLASTA